MSSLLATAGPSVLDRAGDVLTEACEHRIILTIPASSLQNGTGAGRLNDGTVLSPSLTGYLGCDADIIP
ncbi:MAG: hypothetical protein M3381_07700, partial [Actinomycetota bacterium]|nr:hypothetical protein [Actinomycetota bacterium]